MFVKVQKLPPTSFEVISRVYWGSFDVAMVTNFDVEAILTCSLVKALQTCTKSFPLTLLV